MPAITAHAPAPWRVAIARDHADVYGAGSPHVLATVYGSGNARLIAAAPVLLAALRRLVERADTSVLADGSSLDTLEAHTAIARAAGETFGGAS